MPRSENTLWQTIPSFALFTLTLFVDFATAQQSIPRYLQPQLATSIGGVRSQRHPGAAISTALPKNGAGIMMAAPKGRTGSNKKTGTNDEMFMTAPQCKCKDIEECSQELESKSNKCKVMPKCENILKKIGNSAKIRSCLDREQKEMERLEKCVEKRVGPIGCTNEEHPKNLTIPVIPMMGLGEAQQNGRRKRAANGKSPPPLPTTQEAGHAPIEMSDYLMCVDECTMDELNNEAKMCAGRGPLNCALKLRCALAPPDDRSQTAFEDCEKELGLTAQSRFKASCECLKAAGIHIQCPK
ncbi:hypothetical protein Ddc_07251 [Ditylenchus destructor]|nr:hypothetical protein Ddc_07251 [Ditylenchus destructor]